jgi:hypothetical protein
MPSGFVLSGVLTRERLRERAAVREVSMQDLVQLGMRHAQLPAADRRHTFNGVATIGAMRVGLDKLPDGKASRLRRTVAGFSPRPFSAPEAFIDGTMVEVP